MNIHDPVHAGALEAARQARLAAIREVREWAKVNATDGIDACGRGCCKGPPFIELPDLLAHLDEMEGK